jgi:hypothetical protein
MPNVFTWLLIPGLLAGELLGGAHSLALAATITINTFTINTLIYSFVIFCLLAIIVESFPKVRSQK